MLKNVITSRGTAVPCGRDGANQKLSQSWQGPYWVLSIDDPDITLQVVYHPQSGQIQVHQSRVTPYPDGMPPAYYWYGRKQNSRGGSPRFIEQLAQQSRPVPDLPARSATAGLALSPDRTDCGSTDLPTTAGVEDAGDWDGGRPGDNLTQPGETIAPAEEQGDDMELDDTFFSDLGAESGLIDVPMLDSDLQVTLASADGCLRSGENATNDSQLEASSSAGDTSVVGVKSRGHSPIYSAEDTEGNGNCSTRVWKQPLEATAGPAQLTPDALPQRKGGKVTQTSGDARTQRSRRCQIGDHASGRAQGRRRWSGEWKKYPLRNLVKPPEWFQPKLGNLRRG